MGVTEFLRRSAAQVADRRWLGIALLLLLFLGGTNALLAISKPPDGARPGALFALAGLVRVLALVSISVAALRIATGSPRARWAPDGGFWLYLGIGLLGLAGALLGAALGAGLPQSGRILLTELGGIVLSAPLMVWGVAAAVERPLAWSPAPGLRRLRAWLPAMLVWEMLIAVPLASLHAFLSLRMIDTVGTGAFWPLAVADALASVAVVLVGLSLHLTAYRSVAPA